VFEALRYLECDPEVAGTDANPLSISVERHRSYYRMVQEGEILREQMTPQAVCETLHAELTLLSLADFPHAPIIHAASLRCKGHRILLVGPKGGGKTVLTLHLIRAGYEIEGDENVFVTMDGVVSRPRALRVKQSSMSLLPYLTEALGEAGYYQDAHGSRIFNLNPRRAGAPFWRIEQGQVDVVVLIRPNHGGYSSLRPVPPLSLVREVMAECGLPATGRSAAVAAIAKVIGNAKGYDLSLGEIGRAVECIDQVFEELA
jgi:energy-coupling factor transporter ATP-binding protein EcfA2